MSLGRRPPLASDTGCTLDKAVELMGGKDAVTEVHKEACGRANLD